MSLSTTNFLLDIKEKIKYVRQIMTNIEEVRSESESILNQFVQKNVQKIQRSKCNYIQDMLNYYKQEENFLREALNVIQEIRRITIQQKLEARNAGKKDPIRRGILMKTLINTAKTLPLFVGELPNSTPPSLCGCIPAKPNYIAQYYDMVAAHVKSKKIGATWILAEVKSFDESKNTYIVEDIDDEDKATYSVLKRNVIPLPEMRANPATDDNALFPCDAIVLALYPQTTCFYKAKIHSQPATLADDYVVIFEDELAVPLFVPQRYVVVYRETKKKRLSQVKVEPKDKTITNFD